VSGNAWVDGLSPFGAMEAQNSSAGVSIVPQTKVCVKGNAKAVGAFSTYFTLL
jgi:hypothetical protein